MVALDMQACYEGAVVYFLDFPIFDARRKLNPVALAIRAVVLSLTPFLNARLAKNCGAATLAVDWFVLLGH